MPGHEVPSCAGIAAGTSMLASLILPDAELINLGPLDCAVHTSAQDQSSSSDRRYSPEVTSLDQKAIEEYNAVLYPSSKTTCQQGQHPCMQ